MCAIAGLLGRHDRATIDAMSEALCHRGPDDDGLFLDQQAGIALAHRRLAIQDLSPTGAQPMRDASGRYTLVYNGELYNHLDLRGPLAAEGASFRGSSDTETLLEGMARHGPAFLSRCNGIFALALWDSVERCLIVARDGLGVKPLYCAHTPSGFAFASELKALLALPDLDRTLDPVAARAYLGYLWSPGERTMFQTVKKLAPGTWLRIGCDGTLEEGRFWSLPEYAPDTGMTPEQAVARTGQELGAAVERQMLSDVEVGAFLSGGLDSTSIVHYARQYAPGPLQCFTISYKERPGEAGEMIADLPFARAAAAHLGVPLHEVEVSSAMADDLTRLVSILDEPQADPAALNNLYISALAREAGIKVLLGGAGGDDVLTGYRRHRAFARDDAVGRVPGPLRALANGAAQALPGSSHLARRTRKLTAMMQGGPDERLMRAFEWLPLDRVDTLFAQPLADATAQVRAPMQAVLDAHDGAPAVERLLRLDQSFFLTDHNLNYTDKTGMAASVEIRVPFLDADFMAFAATLPLEYKMREGQTKWVLRKAMEGLLPQDVIYRPKTGFGVPLRSWLRHELRVMVEEMTAPAVIEARGLFNAEAVAALKRDIFADRVDGAYTLLGIVMIELWCRQFADCDAASQLP